MGRKVKSKSSKLTSVSEKESENDKVEEFQLNLDALDGYDLPKSDDESDSKSVDEEDQPKRKRPKKIRRGKILGSNYREQEEKRLEQLLFGELIQKFELESKIQPATQLKPEPSGKEKSSKKEDAPTGVLPADEFGNRLNGTSSLQERKAAWVDEDDEQIRLKDVVAEYTRAPGKHGAKEVSETNYKKYLEKNFVAVHGQATPKWATLGKKPEKKSDDEDDEESDEELTKTATDLLVHSSVNLPKNILKIRRIKDLNKESRSEGAIIKVVEFHAKQSVALVAGNSGVATLFQVDGKTNSKIQSIRFNKFPIHQARFSTDGEEFLASSEMSGNIQVHNLITGKSKIIPHNKEMEMGSYKNFVISPDGKLIAFQGRFGYIHLMSARSKEWLSSLKMNGEVKAMTFNPDGTRLYSHGEFGEVYVWDVNSRSCVHKFVDDGCILGTSIAVSPTQQYLACGSSTGVVNVYDTSRLENTTLPKPEKALLNLVTSTTGVHFHASSELMAMYSGNKDNAIRLVHFPSLTVFQNFPRQAKGSFIINSMNFSPNGGYMAMGLNNGTAQLYRLHHYDQY